MYSLMNLGKTLTLHGNLSEKRNLPCQHLQLLGRRVVHRDPEASVEHSLIFISGIIYIPIISGYRNTLLCCAQRSQALRGT